MIHICLNYLIMNNSETAYYKNDVSDLLILNQSYVYDVDPNYFTMFSFKINIDYYQFTDIIRLDKAYNLPGYYGIQLEYKDQIYNFKSMAFNLNITSSNHLIIALMLDKVIQIIIMIYIFKE